MERVVEGRPLKEAIEDVSAPNLVAYGSQRPQQQGQVACRPGALDLGTANALLAHEGSRICTASGFP